MRVYVRVNGSFRFFVPVPLGLAKAGLSLVKTPLIQKYIPEKNKKYIDMIDFDSLKECLNILRHYKGLKLVEVRAKDGTEVTVII